MQIRQIQTKSASALASDRKPEENKAALQSDFHKLKKKDAFLHVSFMAESHIDYLRRLI